MYCRILFKSVILCDAFSSGSKIKTLEFLLHVSTAWDVTVPLWDGFTSISSKKSSLSLFPTTWVPWLEVKTMVILHGCMFDGWKSVPQENAAVHCTAQIVIGYCKHLRLQHPPDPKFSTDKWNTWTHMRSECNSTLLCTYSQNMPPKGGTLTHPSVKGGENRSVPVAKKGWSKRKGGSAKNTSLHPGMFIYRVQLNQC